MIADVADPRITDEIDRFNLEINSTPAPLSGRPFHHLRQQFEEALELVRAAAARRGADAVAIGVLPTLEPRDLEAGAMTDVPRYRALAAALRRIRRSPFQLRIDGRDPLVLECEDVTLEGAATALHVHLRVEPAAYAATFNAAQAATAPVLAAAGNSSLFAGHRLWEETRVALFKQAVDERVDLSADWHPPARVAFGHGWVRRGALELFEESVLLHAPLLPVCADEEPDAPLAPGAAPPLPELRLHHGTVWHWNRAVYDPADGGHLRIEFRALPSGPTLVDMLANAAFLIGLTLGLAPEAETLASALPFDAVQRNFYRAAQLGLTADLVWPQKGRPSPRPIPAPELIRSLLPLARRGLADAGVDADEIDLLLDVLADRVQCGATGARWQRDAYTTFCARMEPEQASAAVVRRYRELAASGAPVHRWPDAE